MKTQLSLYQVTSNRKLGANDFEIEALVEAIDAKGAAMRFFLDWFHHGNWAPEVIAVNRTCGGPILTFVVRDNMMQEDR